MDYKEEEFLMLSGIQHFIFCRRQWALIHIEQQWADNVRTIDGELFHKNAHNDGLTEKRGNLIITRGLRIKSASLGIAGVCDVVEFHKSEDGIRLFSYDDLWQPYPVEYKKGQPKADHADEAQLCAQAMCLEEMLACSISNGSLFYGETRRRTEVIFTESLRNEVKSMLREMHELWSRGYTPKVKPRKGCSACTLKEMCLPKLNRVGSVSDYIEKNLVGE